jgi:hypothetical protein
MRVCIQCAGRNLMCPSLDIERWFGKQPCPLGAVAIRHERLFSTATARRAGIHRCAHKPANCRPQTRDREHPKLNMVYRHQRRHRHEDQFANERREQAGRIMQLLDALRPQRDCHCVQGQGCVGQLRIAVQRFFPSGNGRWSNPASFDSRGCAVPDGARVSWHAIRRSVHPCRFAAHIDLA